MEYVSMRFRKYYDAVRTNRPFLRTSLKQKIKIALNVLKFFNSHSKKALVINNKPVTAQIEPTSECNLACVYCIRDKVGVPIGRMSFETFKKVLDRLDCLFKINISGQGELFMNPEIFKMIAYANKRGILVNATSNGTLITKTTAEKICKVDIGEISISIDSTIKEKYEKVRVNANFDKLIGNIKNLCLEIKKRKRKTIVSFAIVILKDNIDELPEFVKLANKLGVKKIAFQSLQTIEHYFKNYGKETKSQLVSGLEKKIHKKMREAEELAKKYGITIIFDEIESPGCLWPWRGINITWNGYATVCCKVINYNEPLMGNILKENFWKVWNGKNYQIFRKRLGERKVPFPCCNGCNRV